MSFEDITGFDTFAQGRELDFCSHGK